MGSPFSFVFFAGEAFIGPGCRWRPPPPVMTGWAASLCRFRGRRARKSGAGAPLPRGAGPVAGKTRCPVTRAGTSGTWANPRRRCWG